MRSMRKLVLLLVTLSMLLVACGGQSAPSSSSSGGGSSTPATTPAASQPADSAPAASQSADKPATMTNIAIAMPSKATNFLPWFVAIEKGMFEEQNLKVDYTYVAGGTTAARALVAGEYHFIATLPESGFTARNQGAGVKIIGALNNQTVYTITASPDIQSPEDLKGKNFAVNNFGTGVDFQARYFLQAVGLEPMVDVQIVQAGDVPDRLAAIKTGQVAATLLSPPTDFRAEKEGLKILGKMSDYLKTYNHEVIITTDQIIKETPEVVRAFMKATSDAIDWINENQQEAMEIGQRWLDAEPDEAQHAFDYLLPTFPKGARQNRDGVEWTLNALKEAGAIDQNMRVEDVVDFSFEL